MLAGCSKGCGLGHRHRCKLLVSVCLLLLVNLTSAKPKKDDKVKKEEEPKGSQKCQQGIFGSLVKDSAIPLCDEHFPDKNSKSAWLVAFYNKDTKDLNAVLNRVAVDVGNEPPQKSKAIKTQKKKQRQRIKDLAEKYEFEPIIPKKGLNDKDALLKVGAVCCDCGKDYDVCKARGTGISIFQPGKDEIVMPFAADLSSFKAADIVTFVMGELGFMAGYGSHEEAGVEAEVGKTDAWSETLAELQKSKQKAVEDEDFARAQELKNAIEKLEKDAAKKKTDGASNKLKELQEQKNKAVEDEDFKRAKELKLEIEQLEKKIAKSSEL